MLFVTSVLTSFVLDAVLRNRVSQNLTIFYIGQLPVPRHTESDPEFTSIVERAARLICTTPEFDDLAKDVGLGSHRNGATDPVERACLRAELDGLIAHLYGLTEAEFAHILSTFPIVDQQVKDDALAAYREQIPAPSDPDIAQLIATGEGVGLEFKSTARWNVRDNKQDKTMEHVIRKTVAALLNTNGGDLLIGVDDDGNALGLDLDLKTLGKKKDLDGYELFLGNLLLDSLGKDLSPSIKTTFPTYDGKTICRINVSPAPRPVYIKENNNETLYIRTGNSTRALTAKETVDYVKTRWK